MADDQSPWSNSTIVTAGSRDLGASRETVASIWADAPACCAKDPLIHHPKTKFQVNHRFHNSRVCSNAGKAAICSPDIVHRRPKITDRRRPRFRPDLPQSSISFDSKQHQRFDTVATNKNIRTIRNMRNYFTQAAGESQSLMTVAS